MKTKVNPPPGFLVMEAKADGTIIADFSRTPGHLRFMHSSACSLKKTLHSGRDSGQYREGRISNDRGENNGTGDHDHDAEHSGDYGRHPD